MSELIKTLNFGLQVGAVVFAVTVGFGLALALVDWIWNKVDR